MARLDRCRGNYIYTKPKAIDVRVLYIYNTCIFKHCIVYMYIDRYTYRYR